MKSARPQATDSAEPESKAAADGRRFPAFVDCLLYILKAKGDFYAVWK